MQSRVTLRHIAAALDVSISTVSLALAADQRVSPATTQRIMETAQRLGYVRNPILSSIASHRFKHAGKPACIALCNASEDMTAGLKRQALPMGMAVCSIDAQPAPGSLANFQALILALRNPPIENLGELVLPVIQWENDGSVHPKVDLIETCEWWTATLGAIERIREAGYVRPAAILVPAAPLHWHDEIRKACTHANGIPTMEWSDAVGFGKKVANFISASQADSLLVGMPHVGIALRAEGIHLPTATLLVPDPVWNANCSGWVPDFEHRGQVTLEIIEQRLRYGNRPPRRIILPPRWQVGSELQS